MAKKDVVVDEELKPWQEEISKEEYLLAIEGGGRYGVGYDTVTGKYYRSDMSNPAYLEKLVARKQKRLAKKEKYKAYVERRIKNAEEKAYKLGKREAFKSTTFERRVAAAFSKGVKSTKPQLTKQSRAERKLLQAKKLEAEAKKLLGN